MEQILVRRASGEEYLLEDRAAFRIINSISQKTELRSNDTIDVDITSRQFHDFKIGDTFYYLGRKYTLNQIPRYQKNSRNEYQYSATFEGVMYDLRRASYDVNIDTTGSAIYGETLTADLELFAKVLVENANRVFTDKWALGELPENTETKTITFSEDDNCLVVLQKLCDEYDTDFTISTDNNGLNKINFLQVGEEIPLEFKVGFNGGLYNLVREKVDSSDIITRLKVYGSDQNLGTSYRSNKLVLPGKNKPNSYIENTDAIERFGIYESVKVFDDIYPRRNGKVTSINTDSPYKFSDSSMDFDLNEKENGNTKYLIAGTDAKIHFNTGALAGYEFNIVKESGYNNSTKEFHIVKFADENGYEFPSKDNEAFRVSPGDEYVILDIQMPQVYIDNAENELLQKANEYLSDKLEPNVQYSMDIDTLYLQRQLNETVTEFFKVGDFIKVIDEDFGINRFIRIKSIERDLRNPFDYKLVLSDSKVTNLISNSIPGEIKNIKNVIKLNNLNNPAKARRNWKDAQEVLNMVFDVEGDYYTEKIKPNSIETTHLQVGAKSMQFNLIDSYFEPNYQGNPNVIRWSSCKLVHFTIEDKIREWQIVEGIKSLESNIPYYMYARCNKNNDIGVIEITENQYTADQGNYYYFLIGIINSYDSDIKAREVSLMYGFSTVSGRFIKTGRIESSGGGKTYFDIDTGEMSGKITFTNDSPAFDQIKDSINIGGRNYIQYSKITEGGRLAISGDYFANSTYLTTSNILKFESYSDYVFYLKSKTNINYSIAIGLWRGNTYLGEANYLKFDNKNTGVFKSGYADGFTVNIFIPAEGKNNIDLSNFLSDCQFKLEKGNMSTDWTPAPEDVQEQITELEKTNQRINNITSFLGTTVDQNVIATGLLMVGSEFQSNAGISGLNESGSKSVRLWAGGTAQNRNKANWMILDDGTERTYHSNGNLASERGLVDGSPVFNFYHKDGFLLFKLDPNRGLVNVAYTQESWTEVNFIKLNNTDVNSDDMTLKDEISRFITSDGNYYYIESNKANYQCWEYFNGTIPSNSDLQRFNGYKTTNNSRTSNIPNGWYYFNFGALFQDATTKYPYVYLIFIQNGNALKSKELLITDILN
ncbi:hypothetical protein [Chishuiella sp.]|uniref:hypothetical protein n=1 Tax=Chishuiella sp. TaxID=1969467 RepID=UPI0028AE6B74|nr:hypothetical protein [Chishuiella sp.]